MQYNLADIFEMAVDQFSDREYIIANGKRATFLEIERRANQLAHYLMSQGIKENDHVGIYASNCVEWVEALWAVFKIRAVWININYRYVEDELRYLFENADLKALIFQKKFSTHVNNLQSLISSPQSLIMIDDHCTGDLPDFHFTDYEQAIHLLSSTRDFGNRSEKDLYMIYTGGTTGLPKGVLWHHKDVFFALGGGVNQSNGDVVSHPQQVLDRGLDNSVCMLPIAPLMHGATQWAVMGGAFEGRKIVLMEKFDSQEIWQLIQDENVNGLFITGDAMARPIIEHYEKHSENYQSSSLFLLASSAVAFSQTIKDQFLDYFPDLMIVDAMGSSETGGTGLQIINKSDAQSTGGPIISPTPGCEVLDPQSLMPLHRGSDTIGFLATSGYLPIGYYKDEKKTRQTFVKSPNGKRYAMPGDFAKVLPDGNIMVLGRGSVCINSGGEKIFPEEVEAAIKSHPDVFDVTVVGAADKRWGTTVAAVVQPRSANRVELLSIQQHCRKFIAGYKIPRQLHIVESIIRSPAGKPDYRWAKQLVEEGKYLAH